MITTRIVNDNYADSALVTQLDDNERYHLPENITNNEYNNLGIIIKVKDINFNIKLVYASIFIRRKDYANSEKLIMPSTSNTLPVTILSTPPTNVQATLRPTNTKISINILTDKQTSKPSINDIEFYSQMTIKSTNGPLNRAEPKMTITSSSESTNNLSLVTNTLTPELSLIKMKIIIFILQIHFSLLLILLIFNKLLFQIIIHS